MLIAHGHTLHTVDSTGLDGPADGFVGLWECFGEQNELPITH